MAGFGLDYPVVVKPDIGCNGTGVRLVRDRAALARYLQAFPPGETVVLQHYVEPPNEAGIFYVRHPDERRGRITSLTIKQPPVVVGDGRSTLRALILADERARLVPHLYLERLKDGSIAFRRRANTCSWSLSAIIAKAPFSAMAVIS